MGFARYLTLVWPGLPWLWLRGSLAGLVLALAFAVAVDVGVVTTWIWSELVGFELRLALWTATAAVWLGATASAVTSFPPPLPRGRDTVVDGLFVTARDAYLARDWLAAETRIRAVLDMHPTDGEAQLLLGALLRRVGRLDEAQAALEVLSRSDSGMPWRAEIAKERARVAAAQKQLAGVGADAVVTMQPSNGEESERARAA